MRNASGRAREHGVPAPPMDGTVHSGLHVGPAWSVRGTFGALDAAKVTFTAPTWLTGVTCGVSETDVTINRPLWTPTPPAIDPAPVATSQNA
ncbi:hypothetical protein [Kibdelosporangium philippinense]|uniref:hypothetical protein n=1 Tax=Kibdelosporangium philippinense TaxID=211113 RepID=UPI003621EB07